MGNQERAERPNFNGRTTTGKGSGVMTRRKFLNTVGVGVAGAAGLGLAVAEVKRDLVSDFIEKMAEKPLTKEQREAAKMLREGRGQVFYNLEIREILKNGEVIPAKLRNKPRVGFDNTDTRAGEVVGTLKAGTIIDVAIQWDGNNPHDSRNRDSHGIWFAFFNPENPDIAVFSYSGNIMPRKIRGPVRSL